MPPTTASSRVRSLGLLLRGSAAARLARVSMDSAMESKVGASDADLVGADDVGPHRQVAALDLPGGQGEATEARPDALAHDDGDDEGGQGRGQGRPGTACGTGRCGCRRRWCSAAM